MYPKAQKLIDTVQPRIDDVVRLEDSRSKKLKKYNIVFDQTLVTRARHSSVHVASAVLGSALVDAAAKKQKQRRDRAGAPADDSVAKKKESEDARAVDATVASALKLAYRIYQLASGFDTNTAALFHMLSEFC